MITKDQTAQHFGVGEKVVYPQYGLGEVVDVISKQLADDTHSFYKIIFSPKKSVEILVPVHRATENGLRQVMSRDDIDHLLYHHLSQPRATLRNQQWHRWHKKTMECLKTTNATDLADTYQQLRFSRNEKPLSYTEKKILAEIEYILATEISVVKSLTLEDARQVLAECCNQSLSLNAADSLDDFKQAAD